MAFLCRNHGRKRPYIKLYLYHICRNVWLCPHKGVILGFIDNFKDQDMIWVGLFLMSILIPFGIRKDQQHVVLSWTLEGRGDHTR